MVKETKGPEISNKDMIPTGNREKFLAMQQKIAKELKDLFDKTEKDSKKFVQDIAKKYKKELLGVVIVPPKPPRDPKEKPKLTPELLVVLDVKKGKNLSEQVKNAIPIFKDIIDKGKTSLPGIKVNPILLGEIWAACMKGHHEVLRLIAVGKIVQDSGWLTALKAVELHKKQVVAKLDKYVVSYVVVGSLVRGDVGPESDLDAYIIIDDTDVTRMTASELITRLRGMINTMAFDIESKLGIRNKVHIQVHVLTDVWNSIKNANPVVFTFLRDGVPLYDRGMFTPWRLLLKKGRVSPTPEAVDNYLKSGRMALDKVEMKLRSIAMEDLHWATITPSQGLLMLLGVPPVAPKEISSKIREHLVKPGLLEEKYAKIWDDLFKLRKDIEHRKIKKVAPQLVLDYSKKAKEYLDRLEKLFDKLEKSKVKEAAQELYEKTADNAQAALKMIGSKANKKNIVAAVKQELVGRKLASRGYLSLIEKVIKINASLETTRQEVASLEFEEERLSKEVFDRINAEKGKGSEKFKIVANYAGGKKTANLWMFGDEAFIMDDISKPGAPITKYRLSKKGSLQEPQTGSLKMVEKKLATFAGKPTEITEDTVKSLKEILANDVRLVLG